MKTHRFIIATTFALFMGLGTVSCVGDGTESDDYDESNQALKGPSIVEIALAVNGEGSPFEGAFDTLIAAILAADPDVLKTLTSRGQRTVFAPTDDAFEMIGLYPENVGDLDQEFLTEVLLYHVAHGKRYADDVVDSERIRTLLGDFLFQSEGTLTDNLGRTAKIIVTDVEAANGIIHVIDAVVLPYAP